MLQRFSLSTALRAGKIIVRKCPLFVLLQFQYLVNVPFTWNINELAWLTVLVNPVNHVC